MKGTEKLMISGENESTDRLVHHVVGGWPLRGGSSIGSRCDPKRPGQSGPKRSEVVS